MNHQRRHKKKTHWDRPRRGLDGVGFLHKSLSKRAIKDVHEENFQPSRTSFRIDCVSTAGFMGMRQATRSTIPLIGEGLEEVAF
jgi:hypothetical protein